MLLAPSQNSTVRTQRSAPRLPDPLETRRVALPALDVIIGGAGDPLRLRLAERADHARRGADDQRMVRELLALGHQRAGADQRIAPDLGAVEHDRAHSD